MAVGFRGRILRYVKAIKRGVTVPTVKTSLHEGENVNAEIYGPSGDDSPPLPDDMGFFAPDETTGGVVNVGVIDQANAPAAAPGERRLYARDANGAPVVIVWLKGDGTLELNGTVDNAVRYSALETAFNQLKADFDAHTHLYTPGAGTPTQNGQPTASTADITGAKVNEVKLP